MSLSPCTKDAVPNSDIFNDGWNAAPSGALWTTVDELFSSANDSDYIYARTFGDDAVADPEVKFGLTNIGIDEGVNDSFIVNISAAASGQAINFLITDVILQDDLDVVVASGSDINGLATWPVRADFTFEDRQITMSGTGFPDGIPSRLSIKGNWDGAPVNDEARISAIQVEASGQCETSSSGVIPLFIHGPAGNDVPLFIGTRCQILVPQADNQVSDWVDQAGGNIDLFKKVDEGTNSPDDTNFVEQDVSKTISSLKFDMGQLLQEPENTDTKVRVKVDSGEENNVSIDAYEFSALDTDGVGESIIGNNSSDIKISSSNFSNYPLPLNIQWDNRDRWDTSKTFFRVVFKSDDGGDLSFKGLKVSALDLESCGSSIVPTNNIPLSITGHSANTSDIPLFVDGIVQNSVSLFIEGKGTESGIPLFIEGSGVTGNIPLFISGPKASGIPLFIHGLDIRESGVPLFIEGRPPVSVNIPIFVKAKDPSNIEANIPLFLWSTQNSGLFDDVNLFIKGPDKSGLTNQGLDLFLETQKKDDVIGKIPLHLNSPIPKKFSNIPLFLQESTDIIDSGISLFLNVPSGTEGTIPLTGNMPLVIEKKQIAQKGLPLFTKGPIQSSSGLGLYLEAGRSSSGITLFTQGLDTTTRNLIHYIHGN